LLPAPAPAGFPAHPGTAEGAG